jgi:formamidopyrimidine-DNA glycosylase
MRARASPSTTRGALARWTLRRRRAVEAHWLLKGLGPEPLGNAFNDDHLARAFAGKRTPVKSALLDQRIVAGLGNIYVCEALYRAGISPLRHAGRIGRPRIAQLVADIREVLAEAIEAGGSSLRDYRQADGDLGYFQHNFRVYGREGDRAKPPIAAASFAAKCSPGGPVSTAPFAKDSLNPALAVLTLPS